MGGVFSTSNNLTGVVMFGDQIVIEPFIATSRVFSCRLTNLVAQTGEAVDVLFWEDLNGNGIRDRQELATSQRIFVDGTNTVVYCRLPLGPFDSDEDGMLDYWEIEHGLSPLNASDALNDDDDDGLINLHEYVANCDPSLFDGTNTALHAFSHTIDNLVKEYLKSKITFSNKELWIRNTNCWAYGVNVNCASPFNSTYREYRAGTAVTKRHILYAQHFKLAIGSVVKFVGSDNTVYERILQGSRDVVGTDITIGVLSSDLPDAISPAFLLPESFSQYIGDAKRLPMLMFDQVETAIVTDSNSLGYGVNSADGLRPCKNGRVHYFENVVSGDSGDPKFFVTNVMGTVPSDSFRMPLIWWRHPACSTQEGQSRSSTTASEDAPV